VNKMYDIERISKIISDIKRYFHDLKGLDINNVEDLDDKKNLYSVSMILFLIINRTIDLSDEIVMGNNLGMPSTYREIFKLLAKNRYIDNTLMEKMSNLVFYRNLLVHEYFDMTEKDVFDVLQRIDIVRQFVDIVKAAIKEDHSRESVV
jgi:uncharacterized protein YutE (UPF0331/DUF86 family)